MKHYFCLPIEGIPRRVEEAVVGVVLVVTDLRLEAALDEEPIILQLVILVLF